MKNEVISVLNSQFTVTEVSKSTGIAKAVISAFRMGRKLVPNMTLKNVEIFIKDFKDKLANGEEMPFIHAVKDGSVTFSTLSKNQDKGVYEVCHYRVTGIDTNERISDILKAVFSKEPTLLGATVFDSYESAMDAINARGVYMLHELVASDSAL